MFKFAAPVLVKLTSCAVAVPTNTSPKLMFWLLADSAADDNVPSETEEVPTVETALGIRFVAPQPAATNVAISAAIIESLRRPKIPFDSGIVKVV